jgi:pantothenate kinase type III
MRFFYSFICLIIPVSGFMGLNNKIKNTVYAYIRLYEVKTFLATEFLKDSVVPHIKNLFICHVATNDDIAYFTTCSVVMSLLFCNCSLLKKYVKLKKLNEYINDTHEDGKLYKYRHKMELTAFSLMFLVLKSPDECF